MLNNLIKTSDLLTFILVLQVNFCFPDRKEAQPTAKAILAAEEAKATLPHDTTLIDGRKMRTFSVPVILYNNSNDVLNFWIMSCSGGDFYRTDSNYLTIPSTICQYNAPQLITLAPKISYKRIIPVIFKKDEIATGTSFKVGMSVLDDGKYHLLAQSIENYIGANLIWSNEIKVP